MNRRGKQVLGIILLAVIWQGASWSGIWSSYILPSPGKVAGALWTMLESGVLWQHIFVSLKRGFQGFSIAFLLAFAGGTTAYELPGIEEYYKGFLEFMRNVPPISLIALLILWFGIGETSKIIIIVLASFFPMYLNIRKGFVSIDKKLLEVGRAFGFGRWRQFTRIVLPGAVPDILVGMKVGLGYSWRAIIGAEMIAASKGIGYLILDAQQMSRSDKVAAGILTIGAVGMACDKVFQVIGRMTVRGSTKGAAHENQGFI